MPQPVGITDPEMAARLDCVNHLTALLPSLQSQTQGSGTQAQPQGKHSQPGRQQFALAEDWQLQGFLPLQQCHEKLVFEKPEAAQVTAGWCLIQLQTLSTCSSSPQSGFAASHSKVKTLLVDRTADQACSIFACITTTHCLSHRQGPLTIERE